MTRRTCPTCGAVRGDATLRIAGLSTQEHFSDHLRPIVAALDARADVSAAMVAAPDRGADLTVVTAMSDFKLARYHGAERVVLFEHGAGFSFHGAGRGVGAVSYAGGRNREAAVALPATNRWVAARNSRSYPRIPSPVVGCPKLDVLRALPDERDGATIAIGFHWDCQVAPETRWTFPHYRGALKAFCAELKRRGLRLIGTGHPRARETFALQYRLLGIEFVPRWEDVVRRASVYLNDASSTLYEFAALDRPVVVLNAPWYRRSVHHGLRFWDCSNVGINIGAPADLVDATVAALDDAPAQARRRRLVVDEVYPFAGESAERAADAVLAVA